MRIKTIIFVVALMLMTSVSWAASTFYISTTGSDSHGCTNATTDACATLTYALTKVTTEAGDTIQVRGGTYTNHKTQTIVSKSNLTIEAYPGETPIFDLETEGPCAWTPVVSTPCWSAFMVVRGCSNVIIDGLEVRNSNGRILTIGQSGYTTSLITVQNFKGILAYAWGAIVSNASYVTVDRSEFAKGGYGVVLWGGASCNTYQGWCANGNFSFDHSNNCKLSRSIIHDSGREGASTMRVDSHDNIFEYNIFYGAAVTNLYIDSGYNHIARYNLVYCLNTNANNRPAISRGIYICNERSNMDEYTVYEQTGVKVYGNMVANCSANFAIDTTNRTYRPVRGVQCYNNTFVMPGSGVLNDANINILDSYDGDDGHIFKNNIIWGTGVKGIAVAPTGQVDADYNLWSSLPDSDLIGAHDPIYAAPNLFKTTEWNSLTAGSIDCTDFALQLGSPAINAGTSTPVGSPISEFLDCSTSSFLTNTFTLLDNETYTPWDIGADLYTTEAPPAPPDPPGNFACTVDNAQAVTCTWDTVADAESYEIYYAEKSGDCASDEANITGIAALTYTIEGLTPDTQHCVYLLARNSDGPSSYTAAQTPTTNSFSWDILDHNFITTGSNGWIPCATCSATATVTEEADGTQFADADSTIDNRAEITGGNTISKAFSVKVKLGIKDTPDTFSITAPRKNVTVYWGNGNRVYGVYFNTDGIRLRMSDGSRSLLSNSLQYIDAGDPPVKHTYLFQDSGDGTLVITRDGVQIYSVACGQSTSWNGYGLVGAGVSDDPADATFEYFKIGSGVGDIADTVPVITAYSPTGNRAYGTTSETLSITLDTANASGCKWDTTASVAYTSKANTFDGSGTAYTDDYTGLTAGTYDVCAQCTGAGGDGDEVCWQFVIPASAPVGGSTGGLSATGMSIN